MIGAKLCLARGYLTNIPNIDTLSFKALSIYIYIILYTIVNNLNTYIQLYTLY
jgi:hypothetical protein